MYVLQGKFFYGYNIKYNLNGEKEWGLDQKERTE